MSAKGRLAVFAVGACPWLIGCPNPNTYSTPRTVEAGEISHVIALEGYDYRVGEPEGTDVELRQGVRPLGPTYGVRVGVAERADIGLRFGSMSTLGFDLKYNFVRGDVDLAVDPGVQGANMALLETSETNGGMFAAHFPLMAGINFSRELSLVLVAGASHVSADIGAPDSTFDLAAATAAEDVLVRGSVGLSIRPLPRFGLHPQLTVLHGLRHDTTVILAGVGILLVNLPSFADLEGAGAPAPSR